MLTRSPAAKYYQTRLWITSTSSLPLSREPPKPRDCAGATAAVREGIVRPEALDSRLRLGVRQRSYRRGNLPRRRQLRRRTPGEPLPCPASVNNGPAVGGRLAVPTFLLAPTWVGQAHPYTARVQRPGVEALRSVCYSFRFKGGQHNGTAKNLQELH
jgi:hypothetical protein